MFFEMTNSPATFQTMMNDIFRTLIAEGIIVVYLEDGRRARMSGLEGLGSTSGIQVIPLPREV